MAFGRRTVPEGGMTTVADDRIPTAVLGATGIVGQRLASLLETHPWFRLAEVVASGRSAGRRYENAPHLEVRGLDAPIESPLVLSALPSGIAKEVDAALAQAGHIVSTNASAWRLDPGVPLVIPEVNPQAVDIVRSQPWAGAGGALIANPNCVVAGLALALAPLHRAFGIEAAVVVTLQAASGAGRNGVGAVAVLDNAIPWIPGEEEKIEPELRKILDCEIAVTAAVNRVPVLDGHLAHVFLSLRHPASPADAERVLGDFRAPSAASALPSVPSRPLIVRGEPDRPQPRLDRDAGGGMAVSVGRVRRSGPPHDLALAVLSHNGVRGAAGACLANAELTTPSHLRPRAAFPSPPRETSHA